MTKTIAVSFLLLVATTACGGAESTATGSPSGGGGASGSGGSTSTGGGFASGNPAEKFAGTWQLSDRMMSGTCEPRSDEAPLELVAQADGTVTYTEGACMITLIVSGNVAEAPSGTVCGPGTLSSFRVELTGENQATFQTSGSITAGAVSCASDLSATLTRISGSEAQP